MSDFVQFPEDVYDRGVAAFAAFNATSDYSRGNALAMMWFAQLAYEVDTSGANATAEKIDLIRRRWGFARPVIPIRARLTELGTTYDTTGVMGEHGKAIMLAFAGTDPAVWRTVATDAGFLLDPATHAHRGFQAAFGAPEVAAGVTAAVEMSRGSGKPLFIAGHSLGAGLAILAAQHAVERRNFPPMAVYGFGTPRVGDARFRDAYNALPVGGDRRLGAVTYRLVHGRDVVARVPMFLGYSHVGRVLVCDSNGKFGERQVSDGLTDDPLFSDAVMAKIQSLLRGGDVFDFFRKLFASGAKTPQQLIDAFFVNLPPRGHGPLADWLRLLPPEIRDHLQDRYIEALQP